MADEFDWNNDESIIVPHQSALAIYVNSRGDIVIRQERDWNEDDDIHIIIAKDNLLDVIEKLKQFLDGGDI